MLHDNSSDSGSGVSFSSGGVAEPVPLSSSPPSIHARFLLYLRSGACIVQCDSQSASSSDAARSPIKLGKLGFLLVSMQGQLCSAHADLTRMTLFEHEIIVLRGQECIAVLIVDQTGLNRAAVAEAATMLAQGASQRTAHSTALAQLQRSLVLQLRLLLRSAEHAFDSPAPDAPSVLADLNAEHQRLMDAMLQSDDIHKQMQEDAHLQDDGNGTSNDPLSNTRTIPQMQRYEAHVLSVMQRGDLRQRWLSQLFAMQEASTVQCIAAHLIAPAATVALASSAAVLLSHVVPAFAALNLTGPSNAGVWSIVTEYARALCARRSDPANASTAASSSIAISFPLMTPPLRVYLSALSLPAVDAGSCCLIVSEIGPAFNAALDVDSRRLNRSGALISAHWLDAASIVAAESFASALPSALLPADHPLTLAQLQHPRPFAVFESEAALAPWRTPQQGGAPEDFGRGSSGSMWNRVVAAAHVIELDCALPHPSALAVLADILALSSPTLSPLVSVSPLSAASPQSPEEPQQQLAETASLHEQQESLLSTAVIPAAVLKPTPPPPRSNHPRPSVAATELSGAGTASFRMRKMHAATSGPNVPALAAVAPPGLRPHPPAVSPHPPLPLAPLVSTVGAPRVPSLPLSRGAVAVELSMDTPRLETSHVAATPRLNESITTKPVQPSAGLFPPVDKRDATLAPSTLLSKLQPAADGSF